MSDSATAMMCSTTWAGVLPDISSRGHRALKGGIPYYLCKGISLRTIAHYGCTSHKVSDHTCKVSCVFSCTCCKTLVVGSDGNLRLL